MFAATRCCAANVASVTIANERPATDEQRKGTSNMPTAVELVMQGVTFPRKEITSGFVRVEAPEHLHGAIREEVLARAARLSLGELFDDSHSIRLKIETGMQGKCLACAEPIIASMGLVCGLCNLAIQKRLAVL
jgi:hypothetical protein